MSTFIGVMAVLVGLANATVYNLVGDSPLGGPVVLGLEPWLQTTLYTLSAVVAGLVISSIFIRFAQRGLRGDFFARYGVMVLAVCLGGALLSVFLSAVTYSFDEHLTVAKRITLFLSGSPFVAIAGGILGVLEGVFLAFPLVAILGRFRTVG